MGRQRLLSCGKADIETWSAEAHGTHFLCAWLQAAAFIYDKDIVKSLFDEAPSRYQDRNGGYCRVITEARARRGDSAEMAAIELV